MFLKKDNGCKIYSNSTNLICVGIIESIENDFISVSKTKYNFPIYAENSEIALVMEVSSKHEIYKATVAKSNKANIILRDITVLTSDNRRKFFRVNVNINTIGVINRENDDDDETLLIFVHNISCSGILIETSESLEFDSMIRIEIPISVGPPISLNVQILRLVPNDNPKAYYYGCEFIDNKDKAIDVLYKQILKFEQQMISILLGLE